VYAQQPPKPELSCVSVISSSSVQVTWEIPAGTFDGFRLYSGPVGGSLVPLDLPPGVDNAVVNTPNITTNRYEFFLTTFTNSPNIQSESSNIIESILLNVFGEGTGIARLEWNRQSSQDQTYRIYRSEDGSNFFLHGQTSELSYNDTIKQYCDPTYLYYRILAGTCNSYSTVAGANFEDLTLPGDPVLQLVTVNNGFAELSWEPSISDDVSGYIIERNSSLGWFQYKVTGNVTSFTDDFSSEPEFLDPCNNIVSYVVRAVDQCNQGSAGNYLNAHNNIMVTGNTSQLCERKAVLLWNDYKNMQPPVSHYKVERSTGGPYVDIGDVLSTGATSYEYTDPDMLEPLVEVKYRIAAVNSDNSLLSHSCELTLLPQPPLVTDFLIENVTVTDNSYITLSVTAEPPSVPDKVAIYRSSEGIDELLSTSDWNPSGIFTINDQNNVDVNRYSYVYSAKALDACDFEIALSQTFNSVLLSLTLTNDINVSLEWTEHSGWGSELDHYLVYKYLDGVVASGFPKTIEPSSTTYSETEQDSEALKTTYVVESVKTDGTISRSNEVLLPRAAVVNVPTAFLPGGLNNTFKPIVKNIDNSSYLFVIYNRWGEQIFSTNDPSAAWDGSYKGSIVTGLYVYFIKYTDQTGVAGEKRGSVILLQ